MFSKVRSWRVVAGGAAAAVACVMGFAGTNAAADPVLPAPPAPAPVTVTQTVTAAPAATGSTPSAALPQAPVSMLAAPAQPTLVPAASGTLREYFADRGVALEPQDPRVFEALHITLPMPPGWTQVPDPNVPDAYVVIADRASGGLYTSNAQVVIYRLAGEFDPKEAITHGFIDSQQLPAWQSTDASLADFGGFPSALIEGSYQENDLPLNTSRRHVIAKAGSDHYLVSLAVTTSVSQAVAAADATDAIVNGFRVTDPAAPTAAPVAAPVAPAAVAPGAVAPAAVVPGAPAAVAPVAPVPAAPAAPLAALPGLPVLPAPTG